MFEKLVSSIKALGLDAEESAICAGQYFDGVDHGEAFPVVMVKTDYSVPFSMIDSFIKRRGLMYEWRTCWGCRTRIFTIWRVEDRERARRLDEVARAFLDAFWMYRHEHGPEDQAGMIAAGRAAVAGMEV